MKSEIAVIGAGSTGLFTALDLKLRGFDVSLYDRYVAGAGTSGRFHGLLHSGARYAVHDRAAAIECREESSVLRKIAGHCINDTGGLFVSMNRRDSEYGEALRKALDDCGIRHRSLDADETVSDEPNLSRDVLESVAVPDAVLLASDFLSSLALSCIAAGVHYRPFLELQSSELDNGAIDSLTFRSTIGGESVTENTDFVVNATGPWAGETSALLGARFDMMPIAGIMMVLGDRYASKVVNRMREPSDGDIIVPYDLHSILGTTASITDCPDRVNVEDADESLLIEEASAMIPSIAGARKIRTYASVRPLVMSQNGDAPPDKPRSSTRDFIIRAGEETGVKNLAIVGGGKMTTSRAMGETAANRVSSSFGMKNTSKTSSFKLADPRVPDGADIVTSSGSGIVLAALRALKGCIDEERARAMLVLASVNGSSGKILRRK